MKFSEFKPALATVIADHFAPFRERRAKLLKDSGYIKEVIAAGNKKAAKVAEATLLEVQQKMGLR
jgi:tryptophanyl-tRNA synthetase